MSMTRSRGLHGPERYRTPAVALLEGITTGNLERVPRGAFTVIYDFCELSVQGIDDRRDGNYMERICALAAFAKTARKKRQRSNAELRRMARKFQDIIGNMQNGTFDLVPKKDRENLSAFLTRLIELGRE